MTRGPAKNQRQDRKPTCAPTIQLHPPPDLIEPADIERFAAQFNKVLKEADPVWYADNLNEAFALFLSEEPGTVGRRAERKRFDWYAELAKTADTLRRLLMPTQNSAQLLGQLELTPRRRQAADEWQIRVESLVHDLELLYVLGRRGEQSLARRLNLTTIGDDGWKKTLPVARLGRPPDIHFHPLLEGILTFWTHLSGARPTVTVDPDYSDHRSSTTADFIGQILELVAHRLPARYDWARKELTGRQKVIVSWLEGIIRANERLAK